MSSDGARARLDETPTLTCYSDLSATSGSTFVARRAGMEHASSAMPPNMAAAAARGWWIGRDCCEIDSREDSPPEITNIGQPLSLSRLVEGLLVYLSFISMARARRDGGGVGMDRMLDRSMAGNLEVGKKAPDFEMIRLLSHKNETPKVLLKLSSFQGKKPVVLIFGSYT